MERVTEEARRRGLRVYRGKRHVTVTDGMYKARIYLDEEEVKHSGKR